MFLRLHDGEPETKIVDKFWIRIIFFGILELFLFVSM